MVRTFDVHAGKVNVLDYLINELDQDPAAKDKDGLTTVHAATQNERASTVKVRAQVWTDFSRQGCLTRNEKTDTVVVRVA